MLWQTYAKKSLSLSAADSHSYTLLDGSEQRLEYSKMNHLFTLLVDWRQVEQFLIRPAQPSLLSPFLSTRLAQPSLAPRSSL